jgi:ABC-type branched-subunit amino acid transport system ATPase component
MHTFRCQGLGKSFNGVPAIFDLSLQLPHSGVIAIIGPNGAGKTTLLNLLTGFLRADDGECFLGEADITRLSPYQIARLGVARTFQDLRLISQISALDNVLLACPQQRGELLLNALLPFRFSEEEKQNRIEAKRILQFVGLEEKTIELAGALSYGQQKLLSLACCLATKARILFLDEPVAGVHQKIAGSILGLLQQFRHEEKLIIFIEHDISAVRQIADTVIVMDNGRIIARGTPHEVLAKSDIMEAYLG